MKKGLYGALLIALISCQNNKIAFVDNVKLMEGYEEKIAIESDYNTKAEAMNKKRDSIAQAFQLEYQTLQTKAKGWSQKKAQEELSLLQQKSQFLGQQLQQEEQLLQTEGQAKMDSLIDEVKEKIEAYGKANGYTYILNGGDGGNVLYGMEANDITAQLLDVLNSSSTQ